MATRAQIFIHDYEIDPVEFVKLALRTNAFPSLYRHHDGYPEVTLESLTLFLRAFEQRRGVIDTSYCLAQLTRWMISEAEERLKSSGLKKDNIYDFTGYGIQNVVNDDIEYLYVVDAKAKKVYTMVPNGWNWKVSIESTFTENLPTKNTEDAVTE